MKTALITGITGQDGSYLSEFLAKKDYKVIGMVRRNSSVENRGRIDNLPADVRGKIVLEYGDLQDMQSMVRLLKQYAPDEVYNLASQSHVKISFEQPVLTAQVTAIGALNLLEAIRISDVNCKFYQASSSEMFGKAEESPQNEQTKFHPRSPYAISKVFAHMAAINYRESYGMFNACGILFNHESPRRGENFVTRKISIQANRIKRGEAKELLLGNLDAKRDWGFAGDYVEAMWMMLNHEKADEFVIATGQSHSVGEFCEIAFSHLGLNYKDYVKSDPKYMRPADVNTLVGDASKAKKELGWEPKVSFEQLVKLMVDADRAKN
ncbi:GDP-mannose 4,6-dehydratase [Candidatus Micrarchaeota archaeon CG10_big_fil_rev_8_21_14_0_10_45_29]|nr:MAG: GDP-mannose 4,6-dehydratase [Candidatus Micrarchaeota archaeon CG10_big_fil_rev_8_21_14_0_10_45_29]